MNNIKIGDRYINTAAIKHIEVYRGEARMIKSHELNEMVDTPYFFGLLTHSVSKPSGKFSEKHTLVAPPYICIIYRERDVRGGDVRGGERSTSSYVMGEQINITENGIEEVDNFYGGGDFQAYSNFNNPMPPKEGIKLLKKMQNRIDKITSVLKEHCIVEIK